MADWTDKLPQPARDFLEGRRLDEVECIVSDLPGIARGKAVLGGDEDQGGDQGDVAV